MISNILTAKPHYFAEQEPSDVELTEPNTATSMPSVIQKPETVTEFADRCRECGAKYGKLLEAKTGYWKNKEFRKEEYILMGTCSKCGKVRVLDGFCSNCGARMIKLESEESNADSN